MARNASMAGNHCRSSTGTGGSIPHGSAEISSEEGDGSDTGWIANGSIDARAEGLERFRQLRSVTLRFDHFDDGGLAAKEFDEEFREVTSNGRYKAKSLVTRIE